MKTEAEGRFVGGGSLTVRWKDDHWEAVSCEHVWESEWALLESYPVRAGGYCRLCGAQETGVALEGKVGG